MPLETLAFSIAEVRQLQLRIQDLPDPKTSSYPAMSVQQIVFEPDYQEYHMIRVNPGAVIRFHLGGM